MLLCLLIVPLFFINPQAFYLALAFLLLGFFSRVCRTYYATQSKNGGVDTVRVTGIEKFYGSVRRDGRRKVEKKIYTLRVTYYNGAREQLRLDGTDPVARALLRRRAESEVSVDAVGYAYAPPVKAGFSPVAAPVISLLARHRPGTRPSRTKTAAKCGKAA